MSAATRIPRTIKVDPRDIRRLAEEARRDVRTVLAAYEGSAGTLATLSISEAAARLGIPFPAVAP